VEQGDDSLDPKIRERAERQQEESQLLS
jgi:hypothetical protein